MGSFDELRSENPFPTRTTTTVGKQMMQTVVVGENPFPLRTTAAKQHSGRWSKLHLVNDLVSLIVGPASSFTQRTVVAEYEVTEIASEDEYGNAYSYNIYTGKLRLTNENPLQRHETCIDSKILRHPPKGDANVVTLFLRKHEKCKLAFQTSTDASLVKAFVDEMYNDKVTHFDASPAFAAVGEAGGTPR